MKKTETITLDSKTIVRGAHFKAYTMGVLLTTDGQIVFVSDQTFAELHAENAFETLDIEDFLLASFTPEVWEQLKQKSNVINIKQGESNAKKNKPTTH